MALFWRVLLLAALTAADDTHTRWLSSSHALLPCDVAQAQRLPARRPPPPLDAGGEKRHPRQPYLWWKGEEKISSKLITSNGSLNVSQEIATEGWYQCGVRTHGGVVMGYPIHLKIARIDEKFSSYPLEATGYNEQPHVMSCAINSEPEAELRWLKNDAELPKDERYLLLSHQLLIMNVSTKDAAEYRCIATNPLLQRSVSSGAGRLHVMVEPDRPYYPPAVVPLELQRNITVPRNTKVLMACPAMGVPRPKVIWHHTRPGGRPYELKTTDEILIIKRLRYDHEGIYNCSIEGVDDFFQVFDVTVIEAPEVVIPPSGKEVLRASTVRFNCTAIGRPAPTVTWFKDGVPLTLAGRIKVRKSADGKRDELLIGDVTSDDAGVYQCFAHNIAGVSSSWAVLNVTGADAAAPSNVRCWPVGDKLVRVTWEPPAGRDIVAYTVHATPEDSKGISGPGPPRAVAEGTVPVTKSLTPYRFQIRAYASKSGTKSAASELSKAVVCQGQGVPIKQTKLEDNKILISWQQFSEQNPGVVQWILQERVDGEEIERNVTLDSQETNYTLEVSPDKPHQIRVLGSRTAQWLHQDLSLVPWASTNDAGEITVVPQDLVLLQLGAREFTVAWHVESGSQRLEFAACLRMMLDEIEQCVTSKKNQTTFEGLQPNTLYEVRVQARLPNREHGGPFSLPFTVTTLLDTPHRFKELQGHFTDPTTLNVSWSDPPQRYTVHYSSQLTVPVDMWKSVETYTNGVVIRGVNASNVTYVMVTGYNPLQYSVIVQIPPFASPTTPSDKETFFDNTISLEHEYTPAGVAVRWRGEGGEVRYAQNITAPLEGWRKLKVLQPSVELTNLDASQPTYVVVLSGNRFSVTLTIPPRPAGAPQIEQRSWYLEAALIAVGLIILAGLVAIAICLWRRKKKARSPRHRRRSEVSEEANGEEGTEMKSVGGGRLANGGSSSNAGEPLLNGHVHITVNPTSKTPNGKMKKSRYEAAFDVSRYEDPETTLESVLDDSTSYNPLDTSRQTDSRSRDNSFNKLPDDNMNSELRSSFELANSKIQPTLQPNG